MSKLKLAITHKLPNLNLDMSAELDLSQGIIGVYGGSGQGKTTFLKICAGLIPSPESEVAWHNGAGENRSLEPVQSPAVYQDQSGVLFEHINVLQNLLLVAKHSVWARPKYSLDQVLEWTGIDPLLAQQINALSGGEKQRVAFARSLLSGKPVVILDEPFSALDWSNRFAMLSIVKMLYEQYGMKFIVVSHSLKELAFCCNTLLQINNGKIVNQGKTKELIPILTRDSTETIFSRLELELEETLAKYHLFKWRLLNSQQVVFSKQDVSSAPLAAKQTLTIDADKVSISLHKDAESSMLNQLTGVIAKIEDHQHLKLITIDVDGQQVLSLVSELSFSKLQLSVDKAVCIQFKAI